MISTENKLYANHILYSDINPFEVIRKINDKTMEIRRMSSELIKIPSSEVGGFCAHYNNSEQKWNITSNESNDVFKIRLHKNGSWYDSYHNRYVLSDTPIKHYDYNF